MSEAVRIITEQVRSRVRRDGVDLASDQTLAEQYVRAELQRYSERALGGAHPLIADEHQAALAARRVEARAVGREGEGADAGPIPAEGRAGRAGCAGCDGCSGSAGDSGCAGCDW